MANFRDKLGHRNVSIATGIIASGTCVFLQREMDIFAVIFIGFVGFLSGLAPDIDASNSIPNRYYKILSLVAIGLLTATGKLSFYTAILSDFNHETALLISVFLNLIAGYLLLLIFDSVMVHRGHFHSIYAAACIASFFCILSSYLFDNKWIVELSFFVSFFGYCGHLLLDDMTTKTRSKALRLFSKRGGIYEFCLVTLIPVIPFAIKNTDSYILT